MNIAVRYPEKEKKQKGGEKIKANTETLHQHWGLQ